MVCIDCWSLSSTLSPLKCLYYLAEPSTNRIDTGEIIKEIFYDVMIEFLKILLLIDRSMQEGYKNIVCCFASPEKLLFGGNHHKLCFRTFLLNLFHTTKFCARRIVRTPYCNYHHLLSSPRFTYTNSQQYGMVWYGLAWYGMVWYDIA